MKVALLANSMRVGGIERVALNLANGFSDVGDDVNLVLVKKKGELIDELDDHVRVVGLSSDRVLSAVVPLQRYLREEDPDVLISLGAHVNIVSIWARMATPNVNPTHVLTEHSIIKRMPDSRKKRLMKLFARIFYPRADAIVAVSRGVQCELHEQFGYHGVSTVIRNPIVSDKLRKQADEPLDHEWMHDDVPVVMGAGRLAPEKDFGTLLRAFAHVREKRDVRLVITGKGPEEPTLKHLAEDLGIRNSVLFPGFVDNVYQWMAAADVFALSSKSEGFGMVLPEAMACGTPVVSTDCPSGPAEILRDGDFGSLVPVGDDEALADALLETLDNPTSESALKSRAQEYSVEHSVNRYRNFIEWLQYNRTEEYALHQLLRNS